MLKSGRFWLALLLVLILTVCLIHKLCSCPSNQPVQQYGTIVTVTAAATTTDTTALTTSVTTTTTVTTTVTDAPLSAAKPYLSKQKLAELHANAEAVSATCADFIGWLYVADSEMDYPVVKGEDNQYYLSHAPDGRYYRRGTIFLDYRLDRNFADATNILFGHNMVSGMFGDIRSYRNEQAFEAHRYGWLMTSAKLYRIDFFALSLASGYDALYDVPQETEGWLNRLHETALYEREPNYTEGDKYLLLSTCAGDFQAARLMFTGKLVPVTEEEACR